MLLVSTLIKAYIPIAYILMLEGVLGVNRVATSQEDLAYCLLRISSINIS